MQKPVYETVEAKVALEMHDKQDSHGQKIFEWLCKELEENDKIISEVEKHEA